MARRSLPWAAPAVPDLRVSVSRGYSDLITRYSAALVDDPAKAQGRTAVQIADRRRKADELAASIDDMRADQRALDNASLFWVARGMTELVVQAAQTLPEWTPDLALPSASGFLCWARPAGEIPFRGGDFVSWDAAWWRRSNGMLQIDVASRLAQRQDLLEPYGISTPLWSATSLVLDPTVPRTAEANGDSDAAEFVSILGATWLLMEQRTVAETRELEPRAAGGGTTAEPTPVSLVELRRQVTAVRESTPGSGRKVKARFPVDAHWRSQACGPQWSQRKPRFITDHYRGPKDGPVKSERVNKLVR